VASSQTRSWFLFAATIIDLCCSCAVAIFFLIKRAVHRRQPFALFSCTVYSYFGFPAHAPGIHPQSVSSVGCLAEDFFRSLLAARGPWSLDPCTRFSVCHFASACSCLMQLVFTSYYSHRSGISCLGES
jgi:hypothetical protein